MLLFKEKNRERDRERKSFVGFLFEIGSKTCVRITRLLSLSVQTVEEEEEEDEKEKEVTFFLLLQCARRTLLKYKTKKPKFVVVQV